MIIKKFEAPTMQKALEAVKKDLGKEAVILHTKSTRKNGLFGLWGKEMVEITASKDINVFEKKREAKGHVARSYANEQKVPQGTSRETSALDLKVLHSDLNEVKSLVASLLKRSKHGDVSQYGDELLEAYLVLIEQEVSEELAKELIAKIRSELTGEATANKEQVREALKSAITRMMSTVEPITLKDNGVKKVAFVGPTGVGKTTTIAKLAADFALRKKKNIALITIDTYRIAAVEQLRTYADIINVPLEVVLTPSEIKHALEKHKHRDLILIDTAGRSPKNAMQMSELKSFIEAIDPDETHLVLSTTVTYKTVKDIIDRFRALTIDKIIFTKLDEAVNCGLILNVLSRLNTSLSYVTTGQNVPDDISVTDPAWLASMIVEGEK